jgi:hypothetical protein
VAVPKEFNPVASVPNARRCRVGAVGGGVMRGSEKGDAIRPSIMERRMTGITHMMVVISGEMKQQHEVA